MYVHLIYIYYEAVFVLTGKKRDGPDKNQPRSRHKLSFLSGVLFRPVHHWRKANATPFFHPGINSALSRSWWTSVLLFLGDGSRGKNLIRHPGICVDWESPLFFFVTLSNNDLHLMSGILYIFSCTFSTVIYNTSQTCGRFMHILLIGGQCSNGLLT